MTKWEYTTADYAPDEILEGLAAMGGEGWEAWGLTEVTWEDGDKRAYGRRVYFKRPTQN